MSDIQAPRKGAYEFLANGGGAITMRVALIALGTITLTMGGWMWSDLSATLKDLRDGQRQATTSMDLVSQQVAVNSTQIVAIKDGQTRMWTNINDQGNRLTHLEACQPHCQPR